MAVSPRCGPKTLLPLLPRAGQKQQCFDPVAHARWPRTATSKPPKACVPEKVAVGTSPVREIVARLRYTL